ncbi:uncharacterized protein LOC104584169 [Brachypodium distachyon]|uniref:uncharacterized protein LOC104584169 n=1 Tax=Brachypodium distachyon TaxID=15368 RepID=UPI00052FEFD8|nr:uncharacterized protein LOC104584169 [Brachypodium distachyon]|eukprot:XP_010236627.1 uncharacterized protein LOC104584169 [Brachypodium distachyon]
MAEEPEAALAPSPAAPATAAAVVTTATEMAPGDTPAAGDAAGADPSSAQQGAAPAGGAATSPAPQSQGMGEGEVAGQVDDPPPSYTVAVGASSSSAASFNTDLAVEKERQELSRLWEETRLAREEARLAQEALENADAPVVTEEELYRQLEAQRAELQGALDSMVVAQAATKKEHTEVITTAQARIDEKSDLIANYLGEIQAYVQALSFSFSLVLGTLAGDVCLARLP